MPSNIIPGWSIHTDDYKCVCVCVWWGGEKEKSFESSIKDERKTSFLVSNFKNAILIWFHFHWVEPIDHLLAGTLSTCSSSLPTHQIIASHLSLSLSFRCVQANQPNLLLFLSGGLGLSFSSLPSSWLHQSMCAPSSGGRTKEKTDADKRGRKEEETKPTRAPDNPEFIFWG